MSNSLFMDESNGNGLFAYKISPTPTSSGPSISVSNEDLSQSLSEYTDADESISAPTEILAEFLSAVMLKDYKKALKYCELILQYEPNNATAKEFFPIIQEKLKCDSSSESDENYNKSSSPEMGLDELQCANESDISNSSNGVDDDADDVDDVDDGDVDDIERDADSASCMDNSASSDLSSKEEDIESDLEDATSSDLDEQNLDMVPNSGNSSSGGEGRSRSDNTTHSYSSLLLEDEDEDIVPVQLNLNKKFTSPDLDISNGNVNVKSSASCSDSESPTEPLTQRLAAILRTKCVPKKGGGGNETS